MIAELARMVRDGRLRQVDAELGDLIARLYPDAPRETALAAALAARAVADGHGALQLDRAQTWFAALDGHGEAPALPDAQAWITALRAAPAVSVASAASPRTDTPLALDVHGRVYLARYFEYERRLAQSLIARAARPSQAFDAADETALQAWCDDTQSEQARAMRVALQNRLALITGGPGTGKTSTVLRIVALLAAHAQRAGRAMRIALAAPTGKAAARLAESVRVQRAALHLPDAIAATIPDSAHTLHRLLGLSPYRTAPKFDRASPLPYDAVIVDEISMVDLPLMAKLADAIADDTRLILLGDPDQLAAVEAGDVLGALVDAARNEPLHACHIALTRSHRFDSAGELGRLAQAITAGDPDAALRAVREGGACVRLLDAAAHDTLPHVVDMACTAYRYALAARDPADALRRARTYRVLTALRRGPSGCVALDRAIGQRLQRAAGAAADTSWWHGRLLMITANRADLGLFNGDIGVVWPDAQARLRAWFETADGAVRALPPAALPAHEGAFALTVHKAQGSEFERVLLVTGPDSAALTRELLYTAVTRARSAVELCSTEDRLRAGVTRRTLRFGGLADRLREAAAPST